MSSKIVITGATGFSGSHALENLSENLNDSYRVIPACRNKDKLPKIYRDNAFEGNLLNNSYIEKLTKEADIICHMASWAELNGTMEDSTKEFLEPTVNLISSALKNGVKRFIFLSAITSIPIEEERVHTTLSLEKIWPHYENVIKIEKYLEEISKSGMEIIVLRLGLFTGKNYSLGLLPILLPRLKTHLVPWIKNGDSTLPLIDGADIGLAFKLASITELDKRYNLINIVGKEVPKVKEVFQYLHDKYNYPLPHFSVSFTFAYCIARLMKFVHKFISYEPLIVPSIVLLLEETGANNDEAQKVLNYHPNVHWKDSIDIQIAQMSLEQISNMRMNKK